MCRSLTTLTIVAILAFLTSCSTLNKMMDGDRPTAAVKGVSLEGLSLDGADLVFDVEIGNPYDVPLPLLGIDYELAHATKKFLSGRSDEGGTIPARRSRVIPLKTHVQFASLVALASDVKPGSVVDYVADIGLTVDAPVLGQLRLPLQKQGEVPIPNVPRISVDGIQWKELSLTRAAAAMNLSIENTNDFPIDLQDLLYQLKLGGMSVAESRVTEGVKFGKGESQSMQINFGLKPSDLGLAAFRMLTGSGAGYELTGDMDLATPFGPLKLPYDAKGQTGFSR
ncbi:MAG TPA: hypothetical protein ENK43_13105 [Planctomycetes bacterium]|nr:hypothetical protein [Planctomycetota bacterium]